MSQAILNRCALSRRTIACTVLFVSAYTPCLGGFNGTTVLAQTQSTTRSYGYDANGNLLKVIVPGTLPKYYVYDSLNRPTEIGQYDPSSGKAVRAKYTYNGQDRIEAITDSRNLVTSYTMDGLGNQTAQSSPDTGATSKTYDAAGNVLTVTDARGKTTTYSYDVLNRVTGIAYASGAPTLFEYDGGSSGVVNAIGKLTRMVDESGATTYAYDPLGRITNKIQVVNNGDTAAQSFAVQYAYGKSGITNGKLVGIAYPSGNWINYSYGADGRITDVTLNKGGDGTVSASAVPILTGIGHLPFGDVNKWVWGNSTDTAQNTYARGIDLDGRIADYPLGNSTANGLNRTISYDAGGRITSMKHTGASSGNLTPASFDQSFAYDSYERMTGWNANNTSQAFWYDLNHNRTYIKFNNYSGYSNTVAPDSNRIIATSGPAPAKSYSYDAAGNRTGDGGSIYTYSDRGRLASVTNGAGTVTYRYNGLGQRVRKSGPDSVILTGVNHYVYDEQGHLLGEYDVSGGVIQETVYLGDLPIAVLKPAQQ